MEINLYNSPALMSQAEHAVPKAAVSQDKLHQAGSSVVSPLPKAQQEIEGKIQEQIDKVNIKLNQLGVGLDFSVDENTQSSVVKVVDKTTDEVIRQFPTEGSLKIVQNIQDYLSSMQQTDFADKEGLTGILFNEII